MRFQSNELEAQLQVMERLCREISAFANSAGGVIHLSGEETEQPHTWLVQIGESARANIRPDISSILHFSVQGTNVRLEVEEGPYKPYYLREKGMRPVGVFVRANERTVCASGRQINGMIAATYGDTYEERRALNQNLTFTQARTVFAASHMELAPARFAELGITDLEDGEYTNLGLILSDQCPYSTRITTYAGGEGSMRLDQREIAGSVCRQLEDAASFIAAHVRTAPGRGAFYPAEAVREALLNAIEHRDYSFPGSVLIDIHESEMEFISAGALLEDLSVEDIRSGVSESRNRKLARIFRRLTAAGSSSVGIRRIFSLYRGGETLPRIEVTDNSFHFILPLLEEVPAKHAAISQRPDGAPSRAMNRADRMMAMDLAEAQRGLQAQTIRQMGASIEISGRGTLRTYRKR